MPDPNPDDYEEPDQFAVAMADIATSNTRIPHWAHTSDESPGDHHIQFAIVPQPNGYAMNITDDLVDQIESLGEFRSGAAIITREIHYGPWRYVTAEEIENG